MSDANPKIPTPTTVLRLFSQPQITFLPAIGVSMSPTSPPFQPPQFIRSCSWVTGTSEIMQPRCLRTQSPFSLTLPHESYLPTRLIFNLTRTQPHPPCLSDLPSVIIPFLSPSFVPKRLDLLKTRPKDYPSLCEDPLRSLFDSLS